MLAQLAERYRAQLRALRHRRHNHAVRTEGLPPRDTFERGQRAWAVIGRWAQGKAMGAAGRSQPHKMAGGESWLVACESQLYVPGSHTSELVASLA